MAEAPSHEAPSHEAVQEYYGKVLQKSTDLKTNACCTSAAPADHIKAAIKNCHEEVVSKYYGCGIVIPDQMSGLRVLDLGCGAGRDCYIISQLVGSEGSVVGVDMTDEQINTANQHKAYHAEKFGFGNVEFKQGYIEKLDEIGLKDNEFDLIVSNCVINLVPSHLKERVLREAFRVLKPGGELYFSDVYAARRVPQEFVNNEVLWGECLSGAMYWNDFLTLSKKTGFGDPRLVEDSPITIQNKEVEQLIGHIDFYSATYRLFKLEGLESACEDYGQAVIYKGTIDRRPHAFDLDGHHHIETGKVFPVCGNTWRMLHHTRFKNHFEFIGDMTTHYGIFDGCGTSLPFGANSSDSSGACC